MQAATARGRQRSNWDRTEHVIGSQRFKRPAHGSSRPVCGFDRPRNPRAPPATAIRRPTRSRLYLEAVVRMYSPNERIPRISIKPKSRTTQVDSWRSSHVCRARDLRQRKFLPSTEFLKVNSTDPGLRAVNRQDIRVNRVYEQSRRGTTD